MREAVPTAARGHNLVARHATRPGRTPSPPSRGLLSRLGEGRHALLLAPASQLEEWGGQANALAAESSLRIQVAHGTARAMRRLRGEGVDLLITTPDTALALHRRSALSVDAIVAVVLAWPESWDDEASLAPLMQDLPKEAQRIVVTAAPARAADLVERYARRALTLGRPTDPSARAGRTGAHRGRLLGTARVRAGGPGGVARPRVAHRVDGGPQPPRGDRPRHCARGPRDPTGDRRRAQGLAGRRVRSARRPSGSASSWAPARSSCSPHRSRRGTSSGSLPRGGRSALPGLLDAVTTAAGAKRAAIVRALEAGPPERALLTLAPLFERYDPAAVAAALYDLWTAAGTTVPDSACPTFRRPRGSSWESARRTAPR